MGWERKSSVNRYCDIFLAGGHHCCDLFINLQWLPKVTWWSLHEVFTPRYLGLTHWGRDEMAAKLQTTFKCIFLKENVWIPIKISPLSVPKGPINSILALVQIMAWRRPGNKPLSEPMIVKLPTHICVTRPQCVNELRSKQTIFSKSFYWEKIVEF